MAALGGEPGVQSARSGGDDPVGWLLARLDGIEDREARYVSELVIVSPGGEERRGTGTLAGRIAAEPSGTEGFGFDPIFIPDGEERTIAELGNEWKRQYSHRANAARALLMALGEAARPPLLDPQEHRRRDVDRAEGSGEDAEHHDHENGRMTSPAKTQRQRAPRAWWRGSGRSAAASR